MRSDLLASQSILRNFVLPAASRFSHSLSRIGLTLPLSPLFKSFLHPFYPFSRIVHPFCRLKYPFYRLILYSMIVLLPFSGPARWLLYAGPGVRGAKGAPEGVCTYVRPRPPARLRARPCVGEYDGIRARSKCEFCLMLQGRGSRYMSEPKCMFVHTSAFLPRFLAAPFSNTLPSC